MFLKLFMDTDSYFLMHYLLWMSTCSQYSVSHRSHPPISRCWKKWSTAHPYNYSYKKHFLKVSVETLGCQLALKSALCSKIVTDCITSILLVKVETWRVNLRAQQRLKGLTTSLRKEWSSSPCLCVSLQTDTEEEWGGVCIPVWFSVSSRVIDCS